MLRVNRFTFCLIVLIASTLLADEDATSLPKVVLVGDSIRLSYTPSVVEQLAGKAIVISPKPNGGDSNNVLKHLEKWVCSEKPDIVHFNCGIHDTKKFKATGKFQVSPEQYEANLRRIVKRIRDETDSLVIFATSTPIFDDRAAAARQGRNYALHNSSIEKFNAIAIRVMKTLDVPVNDLYSVVASQNSTNSSVELLKQDGVHLTDVGIELVGGAVATFIIEQTQASELRGHLAPDKQLGRSR